MAARNNSITRISLPDIFNGIHLDPLVPRRTDYLQWMLMGSMVVTGVLVVTLGRIADRYNRVRTYHRGLAMFTELSVLLSITWFSGSGATR